MELEADRDTFQAQNHILKIIYLQKRHQGQNGARTIFFCIQIYLLQV